MVQVLPELNPRRTFGADFGKSLGEGVSEGIGFAAKLGLQEKKQKKLIEDLLKKEKNKFSDVLREQDTDEIDDSNFKFRVKKDIDELPSEEEKDLDEEFEQEEISPEYLREATKKQVAADADYKDRLAQNIRAHQTNKRIISRVQKLLDEGYSGKPYEKILEHLDMASWTSPERREVASLQKEFVAPTLKRILGGNFSASEFNAIMGAAFSPDYSKEANQAILDNIRLAEELTEKEIEIANKLKKAAKGKPVVDYEAKVLRELQDSTSNIQNELKNNTKKIINAQNNVPKGKTLMYDPQGNTIYVPDNPQAIKYARSIGAVSPQDPDEQF